NSIPDSAEYSTINIYRTEDGGSDFFLLASQATASNGGPSTFTDDNSIALSATPLDEGTINGNYSYLITYYRAGEPESRPSEIIGPQSVVNGRVHLSNLPTPPIPTAEDGFPAYDTVRVYRNLVSDSSTFYLVTELAPGEEFTDNLPDSEI